MRRSTVRGTYLKIAAAYGVLVLMVFFVYHSVVIAFVRRGAYENLDLLRYQILDNVNGAFGQLDDSASFIVYNKYIQAFLMEPADTRYEKGMRAADAIESATYKVPLLDMVVLYDTQGSFYRFGGEISNQECRKLFEDEQDASGGAEYSVLTLGGKAYFSSASPVYSVGSDTPRRVGTAVLLSAVQKSRALFSSYSRLSEITVCVTDSTGTIFISSERELEGQCVGTHPLFAQGMSYVQSASIGRSDLRVELAFQKGNLLRYNHVFVLAVLLVIAAVALLTFSFMYTTDRQIVDPIARVIGQMKALRGDSLRGRVEPAKGNPEIGLLVEDINALLDRTEDYSRRVFSTQQMLYETQLKKQQMQIYLLRRQINAHFIFNALNTIRVLGNRAGDGDIAEIADGLAALIRYSYSQEEFINIFEEMEIILQYVKIMNIRFQNRFQLVFDVDDELCGYQLLRQLLQPVVENAILHGLEQKVGQGVLSITGTIQDGDAVFTVLDDGIGMTAQQLERMQQKMSSDAEDYAMSGIALMNIAKRIRFHHGTRYGVTLRSTAGEGTAVTLRLPLLPDCVDGALP